MDIKAKATKLIAQTDLITVASISSDGFPRPVVMVKLGERDGAIYTSTNVSSEKIANFRANPKAGVSIINGRDNITYMGIVEIVENMDVKRIFWSDWMLEHFPNGVEDSEYSLLKFIPQSAIYYIDDEFVKE